MTDSERAARAIWKWVGGDECFGLICSDMPECEHGAAKHTGAEADALIVERIREIIDKNMC